MSFYRVDCNRVVVLTSISIESGDTHVLENGAVLVGPLSIGSGTTIYPGVMIGFGGEQYVEQHPSAWCTEVGEGVTLREHVVVQAGIRGPTIIHKNAYIMHGAHIAHDCHVGADATLSPYVVLGGHTRVHERANMGIHAMTHQWTVVGAFAMVGMGAVVTKHIQPLSKVVGNPARVLGVNEYWLSKCALHAVTKIDMIKLFRDEINNLGPEAMQRPILGAS